MVRKTVLPLLLAVLLLTQAPTAQAAGVIVYIDGQRLSGAYLANDTTMVPLRSFCAALSPGCTVSWDSASRTAYVNAKGLSITAECGSEYITANGRYLYVGQNSYISGSGVFMLPVRALAKAFDAKVSWDPASFSASVSSGSGAIKSGDAFYDPDAVFWLSRIISAEARGESLQGQIAVGNVVMNRVNSPNYPDSIYGVIFDDNGGVQFTPVANGTVYDAPTKLAVIAAKLVLDGADVVGGCMYFLNEALATSFWIVENCSYVMTIGNHSFYA
ncbi:MAG: cell wall hydrolase [Clostridiales bacterium]|nr:cell wall hydrolase [Clostridiales bacterium]